MMQTQTIAATRTTSFLGVPRKRGLDVGAVYDRLSDAFRSLDAEAAAALFAPDAVVTHGDAADVRGRDAIRTWLERKLRHAAERGIELGLSFLVAEHGVQNGVVFDVGTFALTGRGRNDVSRVPLRTGRFLAVYRPGESGSPRLVRLRTVLPSA